MSVRTKAIGLTFLTVGSAIIGIHFWPEEVTVSELDKVDFPQENIPSNSSNI
ncbi:hypothetical protein [Candidatus Mycoplasma haematobovis]|uniref:hypothetical protein n=1 Tax=Candidatus Mycoplasma haematobovis TaxID=432608 RepID=UPI00164FEDB6|nr:hypothetical protein [Candidatus Mycoplasma haematobovis]